MRVTKDGNDIFEIDDSPESVKAASAKGYVPVVEMSKDGQTWHDVMGTEDSITAAIGKGYKTRKAPSQEQYSKTESALRGGAAGFTFDFDDELGGAAGSLLGQGSYGEVRDRIRQQKRDAQEQNPWSYGAAEFAGGALIPIGAGGAAKTLLGAIGKGVAAGAIAGGLSGVGASDAEAWQDNALDGAKGAATGVVLGGALGGAANIVGRAATKSGRQSLVDEAEAFHRGMKQEPSILTKNFPGLEQASRLLNGAKETLKSAGALDDFRKFVKTSKANTISRMAEDGGSEEGLRATRSLLDQMSDDDYMLRMALEDGPNDVKDWLAKNASGLHGGQIDSGEYKNILNLGVDRRVNARKFDAQQAGTELAPVANDASDGFFQGNKDRVRHLTTKAASEFDGITNEVADLVDTLGQSIKDSKSLSTIPGNVQGRVHDVMEILESGKGPAHFGLDDVHYTEANNMEQYFRLQKIREVLDEGIDWDAIKTGKRPMNTGEKILADLRGKADKILKSSPNKVEADAVYRTMKEIENDVWNKTELRGGIDKYKLARLLKNTDEANRFRDNLSRLKDWVNDTQFDEGARNKVADFIAKVEDAAEQQGLKTQINSFRFRQGPSSPAIERLGSALKKNSLVQDAVQNPESFVQSADQFVKDFAGDVAGKGWKELNEAEKGAFVKLWVWAKKQSQDGAMPTPESMKANFQYFLDKPGKKVPPPGSKAFSGGDVLEGLKETAIRKAGDTAIDQAYSAVTGEEGRPDPLKDEIVRRMTEKYNLSETEQAVLRRMLPGTYDAARAVGSKGPMSSVIKNNIKKDGFEELPKMLKSRLWGTRPVKLGDEHLEHRIYKHSKGGQIEHVLVNSNGNPVAAIAGHMKLSDHGPAFNIHYARSFTKGKGHGKALYDLTLDTHGGIYSDMSVSEGADKVWRDHLAKNPQLETDLADWGSIMRHSARLKNPDEFRDGLGVEPFKKDLKKLNPRWMLGEEPQQAAAPIRAELPASPRAVPRQTAASVAPGPVLPAPPPASFMDFNKLTSTETWLLNREADRGDMKKLRDAARIVVNNYARGSVRISAEEHKRAVEALVQMYTRQKPRAG